MEKNFFLTEDAYQKIVGKLDTIELHLKMGQGNDDVFLDNQQFLLLMNISKRTAQTWRDQNIIPFSMVGNKIYYQMKDIRTLLSKNYHAVSNF